MKPRICIGVNPKYQAVEDFIRKLPRLWDAGEGKVIYRGRNELREMTCNGVDMVVKEFRRPNWVNRLVYGTARASKAERSYDYARMLQDNGIGTPEAVGWYTEQHGMVFGRSFYACRKSQCPHTYARLMEGDYPGTERVLRAIARLTARIHSMGWLHKDYSRGNILFRETEEGVQLELIDLNRIRFRRVGMTAGCQNFERLPANREMLRIMAEEYAEARGFDPKKCLELMMKYRENGELMNE